MIASDDKTAFIWNFESLKSNTPKAVDVVILSSNILDFCFTDSKLTFATGHVGNPSLVAVVDTFQHHP